MLLPCILPKWRGPWEYFMASNEHFSSAKTELWHINRRFISLAIAGKQHMNGLTHTPGDTVLHEKRKKGHTRADSRVFDQSPELVPLDPIFNLIFTHYNPVSCVPNLSLLIPLLSISPSGHSTECFMTRSFVSGVPQIDLVLNNILSCLTHLFQDPSQ